MRKTKSRQETLNKRKCMELPLYMRARITKRSENKELIPCDAFDTSEMVDPVAVKRHYEKKNPKNISFSCQDTSKKGSVPSEKFSQRSTDFFF